MTSKQPPEAHIKRKRGGQPGNRNSYKHGFYAKNFSCEERRNLNHRPDLESEMKAARVIANRMLARLNSYGLGPEDEGLISKNTMIAINEIFDSIWEIKDLKMTSSAAACIYVANATVYYGNVEFGAASTYHIWVGAGGNANYLSDYKISGNATAHIYVQASGLCTEAVITITFLASVTMTNFVVTENAGVLASYMVTYTLGIYAVTARRYYASMNSVINTYAGGANYFPGNVAGTTATGGQYA